jgi:glutamine synthetase
MGSHNIESIRAAFEAHEVRRVKVAGTDVDGVLRGKYVSVEKFWSIVEGGMGFCDVVFGWDSADELYDQPTVTGWHTGYPDAPARIDLDTFRLIPWEPHTAAFLIDFVNKDGSPNPVSPRQLLRKVLDKARSMGLEPVTATEFEFFIYRETPWSMADKGGRSPAPLDPAMMGYSWLRTSQASDLMHALMDELAAFGVPIEGLHTETGPGVYEAALRYEAVLESADRAVLFKNGAKEICHRHGVMASFMAKPSSKLPGCSGHLHQSMWNLDRSRNLFHDPDGPHGTSKLLSQYVAGQLALMPELVAMIAPNINSYKRLVPGTWAPTRANWGLENRTCALRVIPGSSKATRVEYRLAAADINPYLAYAASIAAGLHGIEHGLECPPPIVGNGYDDTKSPALPFSLRGAADALERSETARALFGDTWVDHYVLTRRWECRKAEAAVTDWEIQRYFELA